MTAMSQEVIDSILKDFPAMAAQEDTGDITPAPSSEPSEPTVEPVVEPEIPTEASPPAAEVADDEALDFTVPPGGSIWSQDGGEPEQPASPATTEQGGVPPVSAMVTLSDGSIIPLAVIEQAYRQPQQLLPPPADIAPVYTPPLLPQFTEEDLENPAVRAVVLIAAEQQKQLARVQETQRSQDEFVRAQQYRASKEVVDTAVNAFKSQYNLPDELVNEVSRKAGEVLPVKFEIMKNDPNFNAFRVVTDSLQEAYWNTPSARQFEFERQSSQREKALNRQRKLNGVGGASGSAPRVPQSPEGTKYEQWIAEAEQLMGMDR